jgi:hypothetical protein
MRCQGRPATSNSHCWAFSRTVAVSAFGQAPPLRRRRALTLAGVVLELAPQVGRHLRPRVRQFASKNR